MQPPFRPGDRLEVLPLRFGRRDEAEAEWEGWRVRVAGGLPGERAHATVMHVSRGGAVAVARYDGPVGDPHPARRAPACGIHAECGGCGLQHIEANAALAEKVRHARTVLGGDSVWCEPIASPRPLGYRAKTFLLPQGSAGRLVLGARPPRGDRLVETIDCRVLRPELEALAARCRAVLARRTDEEGHLRALLLRCNRVGATQLTLVHRGHPGWLREAAAAIGADAAFLQRHDTPGNRIHSDEEEIQVVGREPLSETVCGQLQVEVPPTAFVQGNPEVAESLYDRAATALGAGSVVELFCGGGAAGLLAARRCSGLTLHGIDRAPRAVAAAARNAARNCLAGRCTFTAGDAQNARIDADAVLVNPPRAGCAPGVIEAVRRSRAGRLVYLSCQADTLARDLALLGWPLVSVTPADMFPQTPHLELLAVAARNDSQPVGNS